MKLKISKKNLTGTIDRVYVAGRNVYGNWQLLDKKTGTEVLEALAIDAGPPAGRHQIRKLARVPFVVW